METELETGEATPFIDETYKALTKLIIHGNEIGNEDLVAAAENLQDVLDKM